MKRPVWNSRSLLAVAALVLAFGLASCGGEEAAAPQAPPVTVGKPAIESVNEYVIFTGLSRAVKSADVMARVAGILETVDFQPSSEVEKGELLFTIEKTKYKAARDAAEAALQSAEADLRLSETELTRVERASKSRAVSEVDVDRARANRDMAIAAVGSAQAALEDAELTYSYTDVVSPIDGVVSRRMVDPGNLVGQSGPTLLTRVNSLKPIHAYFHAPEFIVLRFLAAREELVEEMDERSEVKVKAMIALDDDKGYVHEGYIDFIDNEVDPATGTIEMRVKLPNEKKSVFPGLFVRIKIEGPEIPDAVLVPEMAVGTDLGGKYVLSVGENNIVEQNYVVLGETHDGGMIHIREGLEGDATIIVNGLMYARPGLPVTPLTPEQFAAMQTQAAGK
jgi:RND family efflux transporter MFP subunit